MNYVYGFLSILILFVAAIASSCYFYDRTLLVPMYAHLGIFSASKNAVYLFGGFTGTTWQNKVYLNKVYKWALNDPDSWFVEIGTTPATGWFSSWIKNAVLVNEQVFFIGIDHDTWSSGVMFVYDLNTESFLTETKAAMPEPLLFGCLATNTTHIFMVDGTDLTYTQRLPIIQIYDVAADAWQSQVLQAGPMTSGGWWAQYCSLVGTAVYVLGGNIDRATTTLSDAIYRIDMLTLEIEQLSATLPAPVAHGVSIYSANDRNLYLFGAKPFKHDILAFDLDTHSVSTAFTSQQMYASAPVIDVNGAIYRFGGRRNESDSVYYALDEMEICELPTQNPTNAPTSQRPSHAPSATNASTHPQSALNATIQFAEVLQPNTTLQVVAVVRVYALEMSDNITANCSEIVNVSSRTENARTVVILSITILTCSRSAENELWASFNASELGTRIGSVTQSDVDIIVIVMGADTGDEDPMPTEAQEEAEKPRSISWSLVAFGVVGLLLLAAIAVIWFVCRRFSAQSAKHKQDEDVALPHKQEQQHVARANSSNLVAQPDEHKDDDEPRFVQLLREWGLAQFVRRFEAQGYTNVRVWTLGLTDDELDNMGLQSGQRMTFRLKCEELNAQMQRGLDHEQPGSASYSQAEGKAVGALTGVDDGNLVNVELVNMNMNEEQVTAEGDDDDDDDDEKEDVNEIVLEQQQQPQTLFIA